MPNDRSPVPDSEWSSPAEEHLVNKIVWLGGLKCSPVLQITQPNSRDLRILHRYLKPGSICLAKCNLALVICQEII